MEMAPPADQPPSWARPTAAFQVGRWAVVMLDYLLLIEWLLLLLLRKGVGF